jgi:hypothetical protein
MTMEIPLLLKGNLMPPVISQKDRKASPWTEQPHLVHSKEALAENRRKATMSTVLEQRQQLSPLIITPSLPHVVITGDLRRSVTESDATHGPITGSFRIETREMQEPLQVLWGAEGQVLNRWARSTDVTFEMPKAQAGQIWIYAVQAQVTDQRTSIVAGVFVQILVTPDTFRQVPASA